MQNSWVTRVGTLSGGLNLGLSWVSVDTGQLSSARDNNVKNDNLMNDVKAPYRELSNY